MDLSDLSGMSADQLERLAKRAKQLAEDLRKEEPSYDLALAHGVCDRSYDTVANGRVSSFSGECEITMDNGRRWKAIGRRPQGDARTVTRQGYIEFIPLP